MVHGQCLRRWKITSLLDCVLGGLATYMQKKKNPNVESGHAVPGADSFWSRDVVVSSCEPRGDGRRGDAGTDGAVTRGHHHDVRVRLRRVVDEVVVRRVRLEVLVLHDGAAGGAPS